MKCQGKKKDCSPCFREASIGSKYCFQHVHGLFNKITFFIANIFGVKRRFLIWMIIISVIFGFAKMNIDYQYGQILDNMRLEPDIEVEISPFLHEEAFGEYFPLIVTNTGDYTFTKVIIQIDCCGMEDYEIYKVPLLPAKSERTIPFGNKKVIEDFKEGNCYPFAGKERSQAKFSIQFTPKTTNDNLSKYIKETKTHTDIACGWCLFEANILANYYVNNQNKTFNKTIRSYFPYPVELKINSTVVRN